MLKVFMAENAPSLNKGEMEIVEGILYSLRNVFGDVEFSILSDNAEIDELRYGKHIDIINLDKSFHISSSMRNNNFIYAVFTSLLVAYQHFLFWILYKIQKRSSLSIMKSSIWKEYLDSDVILVGHDNAFISNGFGTPLHFYAIYLPFFIKSLNKKIVFFGGGLAHFGKKINKYPFFIRYPLEFALKSALNRMDMITLRERNSFEYLSRLGISDNRMMVTADPAFLLQPATNEKVEAIIAKEGLVRANALLIGMTITKRRASLAFPSLGEKQKSYLKHIEILADVLDRLIDNYNATIVFLPHCIGPGDDLDDRLVAKDIYILCKNKGNIKVINQEYTCEELKGLIGKFDIFIGERIHSAINATSMHVPSLILSDGVDARLDMFKMINQDEYICSVEELSATELFKRIEFIILNRKSIKNELVDIIPFIRSKSLQNAEFMSTIISP
ncbi:MAG: hypothetical protein STSR0001_06460 [Methanothrix sp.]